MSKQNNPSEPSSATIAAPLVAGVAEAWDALTCLFTRGTAVCTGLSQAMRPDALSMASSRQVCGTRSFAGSIPDLLLSPVTTVGVPAEATAVMT